MRGGGGRSWAGWGCEGPLASPPDPPPAPCLHSWTDLVVGAPYFFERQEELGGAVYVYMNEGGHWAGVAPLRLCGSPDSMFGISLAVLGDLNQDGFPGVTGNGKGWGARREGPLRSRARSSEGSGRGVTWAPV